ncbi:HNH endonuclease signature motif containing protein [Actinomycetospora sp. TBRC 11914]|uniref:HNH endonuclease signature motif containing protein n=1 Tax=Actinomycetospora sp. TBRC 11914 TaxID=2729387 RepID=UPI00145D54C9|nr:HNH endonuclease signature motif containing protein [Actinomycetospora sp. TBRC 11914]NMO90908.1 HNH endonuclease [Actinomycetospora sp. TBRC 11914]
MTVVVDDAVLGGLDALPAGPVLSAALEEVDPARLTGEEAAAWMRAWFRTRNHADFQLLRSIREACSARAGTTVRVDLDEFAPKIAAASLGWSATMACSKLDLAVGILERMPALGELMRRGELELVKAAAFVTGLEGLTDAQCAAVLAMLLGEAPELPLGQLRDRILAAGYEVDHVWGANRLAAATARARVSTETNPSGAVNVCGRDLDPALAQDATARLRALALAVRARVRRAGRKPALGFVEARVFVRLIDGTLAGADDAAVIDAVAAELTTAEGPTDPGPDDGPGDSGPGDGGPDDGGPDDGGPDDGGPDDGGPDDGGPGRTPGDGSDERGPDEDGPDDGLGNDGSEDSGRGDGAPGAGGPDDPRPDDSCPGNSGPEHNSGARRGSPEHSVEFAPGTAVGLRLSTLLGLDDAPGTLTGLGPVPTATARAAALARGAASWQVLVHDDDGHLTHLLVLRGPPGAARDPRHRRQTVQVTAPAELLHALATRARGGSDGGEVGELDLPGPRAVLCDAATSAWLARLREALVRSETADPDDHPATTTRDRDRRFPGARLAAWVIARDQTCVAPGCSRPAETCDLDHTLDRSLGGPTEAGDLEALCRHDHRSKHEGGWDYQQPEPGRFVITDPTGTRHLVESRVTDPRIARVDPGYAVAPDQPPPPPQEDWKPRRTRDGRITRQAHDTVARLARRRRAHEQRPPGRYDHDPDF